MSDTTTPCSTQHPDFERTTHLLIRGTPPGQRSRIACGKPMSECHYYVSSRRYVDCEACLRYASDTTTAVQTEG